MLDRTQYLKAAYLQARKIKSREASEASLYQFLKDSWSDIDPAPFVDGWHLEAVCEHLQAVTAGQIRRLVINVPPRTSKSTICSVAWPAWTWAQKNYGPLSGPHVQILTASYSHKLALRDAVKMRRLISRPWYQSNWGDRFHSTSDVNTKERFENSAGGYRLATSVGGALTGEGGDLILIDDPHNATEAESDTIRASTLQWWDESMSTRLNNPMTGAYVIIMQRLHQEDLTGHVTTKDLDGWTWLMLPMRHEIDRHCSTFINGKLFWDDPRVEDGELLCPARMPLSVVENLERELMAYGTAGQLQQSPAPRGGGIIKEEWWRHWNDTLLPKCDYIMASLDTAFTEKTENDASALTIWGVFRQTEDLVMPIPRSPVRFEGGKLESGPPTLPLSAFEVEDWHAKQLPKVCLLYAWQGHMGFPELVQKVIDSCTVDSKKTDVKHRFRVDKLIIEAKANGISVAQEMARQIGGANSYLSVDLFNPTQYGDKIARVRAIESMFSEGFVFCPWPLEENGQESPLPYKWVADVVDQMSIFPRGSRDDFVDSTSMALRQLRDMGMLSRRDEHDMDLEAELQYRPKLQPLYEV